MRYDFDKVLDRRASGAEKWKGIPQDAIAMSIADMDFPVLPEVGDALKAAADAGEFGYVCMRDQDYDAVINWVRRRSGQVIPREHLIATPGVLYTARIAMHALTEPGDKVIVQTPLHTPSIASASMLGRQPMENRLVYRDGDYYMDFDRLEELFRKGAKVMMMCAPNNPTGRVWTREEMLCVAELVNRYDAYLVCDEIHRDILWGGNRHISPAGMPELCDRAVSVFSTSKTFNMGGFHIGSAVIPNPEIREKVVRRFYCCGHSCARPSMPSLVAQTAAYTRGEEWFMEMMEYVRGNFDLALEYLEGTPIHAKMPQGTFLLWADIQDMKVDTDELWDIMKNRWKVVGDPGSFYDTKDYMLYHGPEHHVRLNLATSRGNVEKALERIRESFTRA